MQQVSYVEFESSLNVSVPGMSRKNTYRIFRLPQKMPTELEIAEKGLAHKRQAHVETTSKYAWHPCYA
jgi:uncharacterized membrane protein